MKILQVCPKYYPSIGGVEEHVKNMGERKLPSVNHPTVVVVRLRGSAST
jgi:hypothetical protein